jgi:hypothetical protein
MVKSNVINLGITDFVNSLPNTPNALHLGGLLPMAIPVMLTVGVVTCAVCIAVVSGMGIDPNHVPIASPFRFYMQFGGKSPMGLPPV